MISAATFDYNYRESGGSMDTDDGDDSKMSVDDMTRPPPAHQQTHNVMIPLSSELLPLALTQQQYTAVPHSRHTTDDSGCAEDSFESRRSIGEPYRRLSSFDASSSDYYSRKTSSSTQRSVSTTSTGAVQLAAHHHRHLRHTDNDRELERILDSFLDISDTPQNLSTSTSSLDHHREERQRQLSSSSTSSVHSAPHQYTTQRHNYPRQHRSSTAIGPVNTLNQHRTLHTIRSNSIDTADMSVAQHQHYQQNVQQLPPPAHSAWQQSPYSPHAPSAAGLSMMTCGSSDWTHYTPTLNQFAAMQQLVSSSTRQAPLSAQMRAWSADETSYAQATAQPPLCSSSVSALSMSTPFTQRRKSSGTSISSCGEDTRSRAYGEATFMLGTSESETLDPEKQCAVCGDRATCHHYGARTCEGCKGFFKRTVQKKANYVCQANRNCVIDKQYRNRCQYCRFQRCLQVGMVKEVVRSGSLQGRRGRLPSKTKATSQESSSQEGSSPPLSLVASMTRAFLVSVPAAQAPVDITAPNRDATIMAQVLVDIGEVIYMWSTRLPLFTSELSVDEQHALRACNFATVATLRTAYRSGALASPNNGCRMYVESAQHNGTIALHANDMSEPWASWSRAVVGFGERLHKQLKIDSSAFACLLYIALLSAREGTLLSALVPRERLHSTIVNALKDHCSSQTTAAARSGQYFAALIGLLDEVQPIALLLFEGIRQLVEAGGNGGGNEMLRTICHLSEQYRFT